MPIFCSLLQRSHGWRLRPTVLQCKHCTNLYGFAFLSVFIAIKCAFALLLHNHFACLYFWMYLGIHFFFFFSFSVCSEVICCYLENKSKMGPAVHFIFISWCQAHSTCSSVQDCIYALRKAYTCSRPVSQKFPQCCLWNSSNICLTDDGPFSSFWGRSLCASSFQARPLQMTDGVMSLDLSPQVVSQAPPNFRPSEMYTTCNGCLACQSTLSHFPSLYAQPFPFTLCSAISLHSGMPRVVQPQVFKGGCWTPTHAIHGFLFHFWF